MLVRIRLDVPDRPGSLGLLASTIGASGADVVQVEVLSAESGRAVDDVHVHVRDEAHLDRLLRVIGALAGFDVAGVLRSPPPITGHAELELVARLMASPARALATLVDGVPAAFGADWAAALGSTDAIDRDDAGYPDADHRGVAGGLDTVVMRGSHAPDPSTLLLGASSGLPLRLGTPRIERPDGSHFGGAVVAPLADEPLALLVVREDGPTFHRSETWRLAELGTIAGRVLASAPATV